MFIIAQRYNTKIIDWNDLLNSGLNLSTKVSLEFISQTVAFCPHPNPLKLTFESKCFRPLLDLETCDALNTQITLPEAADALWSYSGSGDQGISFRVWIIQNR